MCVSATLRTAAGADFLGAASESMKILAGVLSIIQPDLYDVGMAGLSRLWADPSVVPTPDSVCRSGPRTAKRPQTGPDWTAKRPDCRSWSFTFGNGRPEKDWSITT